MVQARSSTIKMRALKDLASFNVRVHNFSLTSLLNMAILKSGGSGSNPYVEVYIPSTDTWFRLANLNAGRCFHSSLCIAGKVYVFGGWRLSSIESLDAHKQVNDLQTQL